MRTTENQQLAIDIRDCNVLVSAAAGSGKTSVLVERIISRIIKDGIDIDRLLIMTFTNAAAAEMRSRIRDAIDARISELKNAPDPEPKLLANLEKQSLLVHSAMITTIHGFCKSVVADHFEELGIDPNFRVADENECKLMKQEALDACLEQAYERADEAFLCAVESFSKAKNDNALAELIIPIHRFIMADPDPETFLQDCLKHYEFDDYDDFIASPTADLIFSYMQSEYDDIKRLIAAAKELIDENDFLAPYKANIDAFSDAFEAIDRKAGKDLGAYFDTVRHGLNAIDPPRFGSIREEGHSDEEIEAKRAVALLRDAAKKKIASLLAAFPFDLRTSFEHIMLAKEPLGALAGLASDFSHTYDAIKRDNNVIDFNDMEHMAIRVLEDADIAGIYREQFVEIYVDEYQDSNMAQERLVNLICRHDPGNVFQVGDVKQSIYRFRQARPDIFLGKFNTYTDEPGDNRRILLNDNFRSRQTVTDAVNEIFTKIMTADFGGIQYDSSAALKFGATCYEISSPCEGDNYRTELVIGVKDELDGEELTANIIAGRIKSMIAKGYKIFDKGAGVTRSVTYRDFTILVRSIKKFEPAFRSVFTAANIPLSVNGSEGYFGTVEVRTALSFLASVDNSYCDIELATLMRSPVGGFDDTDMAFLSAVCGRDKSLYERVREAAKAEDTSKISRKLCDKCVRLLDMLDSYKVMSTNTPVRTLLQHFIDNEYGDFVKCMKNATQRMANLRMLLSKAEEYGRTSFKGLYGFVRYMDQIQKYNIDDGEASSVGENDDVVRLMTMHASKGLEFPVCFVAGLEGARNTSDESGKLIHSTRYGFGADFTDTIRRITGPTLQKVIVREDNRTEAIAEEMRILYVAMTRAREKLIMVATDKEDAFEKPDKTVEGSRSYLDMIKAAHDFGGFEHIDISFKTEKDIFDVRFEQKLSQELAADDIYDIINSYSEGENDELLTSADKSYDFKYPYTLDPELRPKLSVSDLKHKAIEEKRAAGEMLTMDGEQLFAETEPQNYIPKFMREEGKTKTGATFYGTAFHRIMELWDYETEVTPQTIKDFAEKMHSLHRMDSDQVGAINVGDVKQFLDSALARRMAEADKNKKLFREQPFVIGVPQGGETVLVQGIIDAYFIEDDGLTIVDYKTDRVSDDRMLTERYRTQLEYYGKALSQITQKPVKELKIYSTCLGKEINVD